MWLPFLACSWLRASSAGLSDGEDVDIKEIAYNNVELARDLQGDSSVSLNFEELHNRCGSGADHVAILLEGGSPETFQMMTSLRYAKDFDLWHYEESAFEEDHRHLQLLGLAPVHKTFSFDTMPGPTTEVAMSNNIVSPYVDCITYCKSKAEGPKKLALIYHCHPETEISEVNLKRFTHAYFSGIPHERNIVDGTARGRIVSKKFLSAGFYDSGAHLTEAKMALTPGFVYKLWLRRSFNEAELFQAFPSVLFSGQGDKARYPERSHEGFFRVDAPFWAQSASSGEPNGTALITIFSDPASRYSFVVRPWWSATMASIVRCNLDLFVWMFIAFILSANIKAMSIAGVLVFVRLLPSFQRTWLELLLLVGASFCLANSTIIVFASLFSYANRRISTDLKHSLFAHASKVLPVLVLAPCVILRLAGIVPFVTAMQLILIRTVFSERIAARMQASSLLLQLITIGAYISVRIPDIMNAVRYYISLPLEFEIGLLWLWGLIVWTRLVRSTQNKGTVHVAVRLATQLALLVVLLPRLTLADIWPGYCVYLSINFATSIITFKSLA